MADLKTLENIGWFIQFKPTIDCIFLREPRNQPISEELYKTQIINIEGTITLKMTLDNDYTFLEEIKIPGTQTVETLFQHIYNFYQTGMKAKNIKKLFKHNKEILDEIIDEKGYIKNIDLLLADVCPPDFVGLDKKKIMYLLLH